MILKLFKGNLTQKELIVSNAIKAATVEVKSQSGDGNMWFRCFTKTLTDELKLTENSCGDLSEIKDLDFLETDLSNSLKKGTIKLQNSLTRINDMKMCRKSPDDILIDHFCQCCWVQCPFCGVTCTHTTKNHHGDHSAPFHRSIGLNGINYHNTSNLSTHICTSAVANSTLYFHPNDSDEFLCRDYRRAGDYADWSITPDLSDLPYWKWFVCRFQEDLEKYYSKTFQGYGQIPDEWKKYTIKDALESLDKHM